MNTPPLSPTACQEIRDRHHPDRDHLDPSDADNVTGARCVTCHQDFPCDAVQLLMAYETLNNRLSFIDANLSSNTIIRTSQHLF